MNKSIQKELDKAWNKVQETPGLVELKKPGDLSADFAAGTIIHLLQSMYIDHAISRDPSALERDIVSGKVMPWIVTRDSQPVSCSALIKQTDGSFELGRATSIENGSGAGKIAMLSSAIHAKSHGQHLVAEVRLADDFDGVPSGMATQKICFSILQLVPHAVFPAFHHGNPDRFEMFGFSSCSVKLPTHGRLTETANSTFMPRQSTMHGRTVKNIRLTQTTPFRIGIPDDNGQNIHDFVTESRSPGNGCTLIPIEVTDENIPTLTELGCLNFITVGIDRNLGQSGLPVVLLATLASGTRLAPTRVGNNLLPETMDDIEGIATNFERIVRN